MTDFLFCEDMQPFELKSQLQESYVAHQLLKCLLAHNPDEVPSVQNIEGWYMPVSGLGEEILEGCDQVCYQTTLRL